MDKKLTLSMIGIGLTTVATLACPFVYPALMTLQTAGAVLGGTLGIECGGVLSENKNKTNMAIALGSLLASCIGAYAVNPAMGISVTLAGLIGTSASFAVSETIIKDSKENESPDGEKKNSLNKNEKYRDDKELVLDKGIEEMGKDVDAHNIGRALASTLGDLEVILTKINKLPPEEQKQALKESDKNGKLLKNLGSVFTKIKNLIDGTESNQQTEKESEWDKVLKTTAKYRATKEATKEATEVMGDKATGPQIELNNSQKDERNI